MSVIRSQKRSSARNAFGKEEKKLSIRELSVEVSSACTPLIDASCTWLTMPWRTGGAGTLAILPVGTTGAVTAPRLLTAHESAITAFASSLVDEGMLATGAREAGIKLWQIQQEETVAVGSIALPKTKRIDQLFWHPSAAHVLMGITDNAVAVCDVKALDMPIALGADVDAQFSAAAWSCDGRLIATGARDKRLRIFDVRAGAKECAGVDRAHDSAKGFALSFVPRYDQALGTATMDREPLCTIGFGRGTRELAVWDQRKLAEPLLRQTVDHQSGWLTPFYDAGTGVLFLGGKGKDIYYYELNAAQSACALINKHQTASPFLGLGMVPKRNVDFRACELARFVLVSGTTLDTLSIFVPRKNKDVFHDDVYQRVPAGVPSCTSGEWFAGTDAPPKTVSLKPADMRSVYDTDVADGGKQRTLVAAEGAAAPAASNAVEAAAAEAKVQVSTDKSGGVQRKQPGWLYSSFEPVHAQLSKPMASLFLFRDAKAASPMQTFVLKNGSVEPVAGTEGDFEIRTRDNERCVLRVPDAAERDSWLASLRLVINVFQPASPQETPEPSPQVPRKAAAAAPAPVGKIPKLSFHTVPSTTVHDADLLMSHREALVTPRLMTSSTKRIEGAIAIRGTSFRDKETKAHNNDAKQDVMLKGECFAVLRYGILGFYRDKRHCRENVRDPIDSLHVDRLLAVRVLDPAAEDNEDGSAVASDSPCFRIVTADRIIDVQAESMVARNRWVQGLSTDLDDGDDPRRVRQGVVYEHGGFLYGWQDRFLAVYGDELMLFGGPLDCEPLRRMALSNLKDVELTTERLDGEDCSCGLLLRFSTGNQLRLRGKSVESAREWADCLSFLRVFASDVRALLLGDVTDIDSADVPSDRDMQADGRLLDLSLVKRGDQPILMQLYNDQRRLRMFVVPVGTAALRDDCVFVLDLGRVMWQWNGKTSARVLRAKGSDLVNRINKKERGGLAKTYVVNDSKSMATEDAPVADFWKALGVADGSEPPVKRMDKDKAEEAESTIHCVHPTVVAVTPDLSLCYVHGGATPARSLLLSDQVYVVDALCEVYVWVGKAASAAQRSRGWRVAKLMCDRRDLAGRERRSHTGESFVRLMRVIEDGEPNVFKERFTGFPGMLPINLVRATKPSKVAKRREQPKIDIGALLSAPRGVEVTDEGETAFPTSGPGVSIKVWVIDNFDKWAVRACDYGTFYANDSYVVCLTYERKGRPANVLFFWQGRDSSVSEKGTSAYVTRMMQNEVEGDCTQLRVVQGKEPREFVQMFDNTIVLRRGAYPRALVEDAGSRKEKVVNPNVDNKAETEARVTAMEASTLHGKMLLYTQGFADDVVRTVQTATVGEIELTHNGVFALVDANADVTKNAAATVFVWRGKWARPCEEACLERALKRVYGPTAALTLQTETPGSESAAFWTAMGGAPSEPIPVPPARLDTRLFEVSIASGVLTVDPVSAPLRQDDMVDRHAFLVDTGTEVFVRFGEKTLHAERHGALQVAKEMAAHASFGDIKPVVYVTRQTREPPMLRLAFHGWANTKKGKLLPEFSPEQDEIDTVLVDFDRTVYEYDELLSPETLPESVDRTKLEEYLSDDQFQQVFGMDRGGWNSIPAWKRPDLKKKAGLY